MQADNLRASLAQAVTTYDRKQEAREAKRKYGRHNPYAIGQYLARVDDVTADVAAGSEPRAAILAGFDGPLLTACLRAIGEPRATEDELRAMIGGAWHYVPASERVTS